MNKAEMTQRLERAFPTEQAGVLAEVIYDAYDALVKASDFSELKATVTELVEAQKRTEQRVAELAEAQKHTDQRVAELAEAQKHTDQRVAELAEAQKRTEQRVAELAEAQKHTDQRVAELAEAQRQTSDQLRDLIGVVRGLATEVGSLSRTMSYSLENEAYRLLPDLLRRNFGLEIEQKLVRTEINGEEINLFGRARRNGQTVLIVGESKLRLDMRSAERQEVFEQLERKVAAVREAYPGQEIMPVLITHYARPAFLQEAQARGVQVFQSFEW
ncbi:MAG: hypothetical protein D6709_05390 [Chloroflexi bacterium]|jgi:Tfp pilus assembly protein PilE|uniref:DUF8196 domain-containing protein n=1 Tax=Candidatus Thermofonsia Clade 3 bacterium TaxID=2364212 RepID=A0A2M8QG68_9CHLR|nr:hypothetical protein [Candidatus Roseilinea sp. NK_OTU-006]PJF48815.1 MAG: hypothetical protein CUN48_01275 [Candidatus Thermofonsia Clade 3 bacterium]RMG64417.1 MAG: hypothetical protein D6709_05390 [Chloroflexota bacterium]